MYTCYDTCATVLFSGVTDYGAHPVASIVLHSYILFREVYESVRQSPHKIQARHHTPTETLTVLSRPQICVG